jgi:hypothetical protein
MMKSINPASSTASKIELNPWGTNSSPSQLNELLGSAWLGVPSGFAAFLFKRNSLCFTLSHFFIFNKNEIRRNMTDAALVLSKPAG